MGIIRELGEAEDSDANATTILSSAVLICGIFIVVVGLFKSFRASLDMSSTREKEIIATSNVTIKGFYKVNTDDFSNNVPLLQPNTNKKFTPDMVRLPFSVVSGNPNQVKPNEESHDKGYQKTDDIPSPVSLQRIVHQNTGNDQSNKDTDRINKQNKNKIIKQEKERIKQERKRMKEEEELKKKRNEEEKEKLKQDLTTKQNADKLEKQQEKEVIKQEKEKTLQEKKYKKRIESELKVEETSKSNQKIRQQNDVGNDQISETFDKLDKQQEKERIKQEKERTKQEKERIKLEKIRAKQEKELEKKRIAEEKTKLKRIGKNSEKALTKSLPKPNEGNLKQKVNKDNNLRQAVTTTPENYYEEFDSLSSAPPVYEQYPPKILSTTDNSGNTTFGVPAKTNGVALGGSWDMVAQHRQAVRKPQTDIKYSQMNFQSRASKIEYNVGGFVLDKGGEEYSDV